MKVIVLKISMLLWLLTLVGCRQINQQPFAVTLPATQVIIATDVPVEFSVSSVQVASANVELPQEVSAEVAAQVDTAVPTASAQPSRTRSTATRATDTATATPTLTPSRTPTRTVTSTQTLTTIPTNTRRPTNTALPTSTPTQTLVVTNTSADGLQGEIIDGSGTPQPTWTPPPLDPSRQIADHYFMGRPIADGATNWVDRTYPYGGTAGGRLETHHGVEFVNPGGTPILAVEAGTVFYVGDDVGTQFGPYTNYYGNLVVIQHSFTAPDGQPVFSLYGHMDRFEVEQGQAVTRGQHVGSVGATGIAMGAHLHFEVRVGDPYQFSATRNPELWIRPFPTYATLAGRTLDAAGNRLYQVTIQVKSARITRYAFSYADDSVNPDSVFSEHFTLGDLPADYYEVSVTADGRVRFREVIYIYPNRTTWLDIQLN